MLVVKGEFSHPITTTLGYPPRLGRREYNGPNVFGNIDGDISMALITTPINVLTRSQSRVLVRVEC